MDAPRRPAPHLRCAGRSYLSTYERAENLYENDRQQRSVAAELRRVRELSDNERNTRYKYANIFTFTNTHLHVYLNMYPCIHVSTHRDKKISQLNELDGILITVIRIHSLYCWESLKPQQEKR